MAMVISTNAASINAQRHLNNSRQDLDVAMERLSSGQRINSAADDAAGLAIRDKMTSQIEGLNQGVRNANDAISFMQTAEGALEETTSILQRMRTLAVQAVNDTNSTSDRSNLDDELDKLKEEITRISDNSTFNDRVLLDGNMGTVVFQIGHKSEQTISVTFNDMSAEALGQNSGTAAGTTTYSSVAVTLGGDTGAPVAGDQFAVTIDGTEFKTNALPTADADDFADIAAQFTAVSGNYTGWTITNNSNVVTFTKNADYVKSGETGQSAITTAASLTLTTSNTVAAAGDGAITATAEDSVAGTVGVGSTPVTSYISAIDLDDSASAADAIESIDNAIAEVGKERSKLGAFQNRLTFAVNNMTNMSANTSAARSLIADADYAAESSSLAKNQILQQAGTAMLAQANAQAQSVLSLLK